MKLPHEAVSYQWTVVGNIKSKNPVEWPFEGWEEDERITVSDVVQVTLANSQRVIVRALSEERKAARRMRREAVS